MPNKLRSTSGRVSFFAFLDMITAVTGVLVLITLLMTLYLNKPPSAAANEASDMQRQIAQAKSKLDATLAELRRRTEQSAALTNRVFVVPERDPSGLKPVLIVLSATNGLWSRPGQTTAVPFAVRADNADFRLALDGWDATRDRLVFYIRPSAIANFRNLR